MSTKPKLLVLASTYPRWSGDPEPGFVHELSRRLTDHFTVIVLCPHAAGAASNEEIDSVKVKRFRYAPEGFEKLVNDGGIVTNLKRAPWMWFLVPLFLVAQAWATWKTIRKWRPDVVHAHWLIPQGLIIALLSTMSRSAPPFLVTSHGADLHSLRFWPMPALKRLVLRRASAVTVVSSAMLSAMQQQGIPTDGVRVEPMGVDLSVRFTPDDSVQRSRNEILFVGRLVEKKGLRYLIDAMPIILEKHPEAHLTIAGFGPEEEALRDQIRILGLQGKVEFLGAVAQENLPELYRRASIFVAPFVETESGDQEGLGLVTVEAIGCGCPVVVSNLPAVAEVINEPKMLAEPGAPGQLANAVSGILMLKEPERQEVVKSQRERLFRWLDWKSRGRAYQVLLHELAQ